MPDLQSRAADFERAAADAKTREVPVVIATEMPVDRGDYVEILDVSPGGVDLSRAPLPLIESHETKRLNIGVVDALRVDGGKLRGIARFGSSQRAREVFQDVIDGIVSAVSIGYEQLAATDLGKNVLRFRFRPYEVSAVSVPADPAAGFFRSGASPSTPFQKGNRSMEQQQQNTQDRAAAIVELGEQYAKFVTQRDVAEAVRNERTVEQFKDFILSRMESQASDVSQRYIGLSAREINRYSLGRAILASVTGDWSQAGLEREASRACERLFGRGAEGFYVPFDYFRRDFNMGTATEAGNLMQTDLRTDLYVDALRNAMVLAQMGVKVLPGLTGNVAIPRKATAGTLGMLSEIGSASETQPVTAQPTLSPKRISAYTEVSKQAIVQSALALESMIRDDLVMGAATLIESQAINGVGSSNEMTGIRVTSGIGTVTAGTNGAALAWSHLVDLESACADLNASPGSLAGYVTNSKVRGKAKKTIRGSNLSEILPPDAVVGPDGLVRVNTYRLGVTNNVPSNLTKGTSTTICSAALFSSDWSMGVLGLFGGVDVTVDPYSKADTGQVKITLNQFADFVVRQPAAFAKIEDILTA